MTDDITPQEMLAEIGTKAILANEFNSALVNIIAIHERVGAHPLSAGIMLVDLLNRLSPFFQTGRYTLYTERIEPGDIAQVVTQWQSHWGVTNSQSAK